MSAAATSDSRHTILVVEDDSALRDTIAYNLRGDGYRVLTAADGVAALESATRNAVSLVVLDIMLPRMDGLEVCRQLRAKPETEHIPILILSARGEETDKVVGLELGADDYVTKPFSWKELRARVRALLRRRGEPAAKVATSTPDTTHNDERVLVAGDLRIDLDRREVSRGERQIELPARLFELLAYMVRNRGVVLTRGRLLQHVWGYDYEGDTRTVDVHIRWLREKIEDDAANPQLLLTVRGVGYRFKG